MTPDTPDEPRDPARWALARKIAFWSLVAQPAACPGYRLHMLDMLREVAYEALDAEAEALAAGCFPPEHIAATARATCRQCLVQMDTDPDAPFSYIDSDFLPP